MELTRETLKKLRQAHDLFAYVDARATEAHMTVALESTYGKPYDEVARCAFNIPLHRKLPDDRLVNLSLSAIRYCEDWNTITSLLRVGDKLRLDFRKDQGNSYTNAACGDGHEKIKGGLWSEVRTEFNGGLIFTGLHVDSAYLVVERGTRRLFFHLGTRYCPENTARMLRHVTA